MNSIQIEEIGTAASYYKVEIDKIDSNLALTFLCQPLYPVLKGNVLSSSLAPSILPSSFLEICPMDFI